MIFLFFMAVKLTLPPDPMSLKGILVGGEIMFFAQVSAGRVTAGKKTLFLCRRQATASPSSSVVPTSSILFFGRVSLRNNDVEEEIEVFQYSFAEKDIKDHNDDPHHQQVDSAVKIE